MMMSGNFAAASLLQQSLFWGDTLYESQQKIIQTSLIGIGVNVLLVVFKAAAGLVSNSTGPQLVAIHQQPEEILRRYPAVLRMHAFYAAPEKKALSFDLMVNFKENFRQLRDSILQELQAAYPDYEIDIVLDSIRITVIEGSTRNCLHVPGCLSAFPANTAAPVRLETDGRCCKKRKRRS